MEKTYYYKRFIKRTKAIFVSQNISVFAYNLVKNNFENHEKENQESCSVIL